MKTALPVLGEVAGRDVPLHYGDPVAEYAALRQRAVLIDRSHRGRLRITGAKAREITTGLVTNDVLALPPGHGCYAAALTPKGKIIADVRIFVEPDAVLVDAPARAADAWLAMVRKFVNPRLAPYHDETASVRDVGVFGPESHHVVAAATGLAPAHVGTLPPYGHVAFELRGVRVVVARVPDAGLDGYEIFVPTDLADDLRAKLVAARAVPAGLEAWDAARIEAGRPEWGIDIDENTIPQEANFDDLQAISYTKGCYVGQETVARVHFRGHVNRHLRGVRFTDRLLPPPRAALHDATGRAVGDVRSGTRSPRLGTIALAMIRREVPIGTAVTARWDDAAGEPPTERSGVVTALPFPDPPA